MQLEKRMEKGLFSLKIQTLKTEIQRGWKLEAISKISILFQYVNQKPQPI